VIAAGLGVFYLCLLCDVFFEKMRRLLVVCTWKMTHVLDWREKTAAKSENK
jgi:hypothetical protein